MGFLIFVFGFLAGWFTFRHLLNKKVNEIHEMMEKELEESNNRLEPNKVSLKFEKRNGHIYCYDRKDDKFYSHGETYEEIVKDLEHRFPNTTFFATPGALKQIQE